MADNVYLHIFGTRGSVATPQRDRMIYGGNTSCYCVEIGSRMLVFDAGTGITALSKILQQKHIPMADVFIGHVHFDHVLGMPFFSEFYANKRDFRIYSAVREGMNVKEQLDGLVKSPYFPVSSDILPDSVEFCDLPVGMGLDLGDGIQIYSQAFRHPDYCTHFRLEYDGKKICYCLDFEHNPEDNSEFISFIQGADILIYDAHFTEENYIKGWGHSTWEKGVELAQAAGVKKLLLTHHNPDSNDDELLEVEKLAQGVMANCELAREGSVITV